VRRRPDGLIAAITPYNNPIYLSLGKIAPALIYGNRVAWKPAPEASQLSRRLFEVLQQAGMHAGLVRLIEGGRDAAVNLMNDTAVAAVTITGSSAAGSTTQEICGRRRIPLQAELGGNNAAIVWHDADLDLAARGIAAGAFEMAGQRCTANRRVIVHESCRTPFLERLQRATAALNCGSPLDPQTQVGPLVTARHARRVADAVRSALANGARPLPCDIKYRDVSDAWHAPTILCCADPTQEIVQEETFGPVLVVQTACDWQQAIDLLNGVRQGLAAAIFSGEPGALAIGVRSNDIIERFLNEARAGILKVNQTTADAAVDVPFGGWKESGIGLPEHGVFDMEFYTRPQTVYL
jgi:acyl-CoA reductase-like NAD-dependent aldehyde dehydrogenase